jgi:hypothetical protein
VAGQEVEYFGSMKEMNDRLRDSIMAQQREGEQEEL